MLVGRAVARKRGEVATEVAKPQIFNGTSSKVSEFILVYKLYIRMRLREVLVEEQIQWVFSYIQGGLTDIWKENIIEDLEAGEVEYESVEEFLTNLKKEFGRGDKESVKVAELKKLEQEGRTMEEFV